MTPTNNLRWVKRKYYDPDVISPCYKLVLQQWWTDTYGKGEWRDVPIEQD